ncbi:hypothetical protein IQ244_07425 [Nostoc sp. LEGE 06077]|uniref:hypothetical protein n=1 Tax=Nostoc sp. LEGE 06077 TaxID=915325 RepID=UPI0018810B7C|nr:hypothetical protein [Nostoc sp. LEGE 06077]MBE9206344.1 hypothetical protein [Nostoc sp. LEGE 06077]
MQHTKTRQALLQAIYEELEQAYEDTLEDVLELLKIRKIEDEEDIQDIAVAKNDTTISWEEYQQESA